MNPRSIPGTGNCNATELSLGEEEVWSANDNFQRRKHRGADVTVPAITENYINHFRASRATPIASLKAVGGASRIRRFRTIPAPLVEACYSGSGTRAKLISNHKTEVDFNDCRKVTYVLIQIEFVGDS